MRDEPEPDDQQLPADMGEGGEDAEADDPNPGLIDFIQFTGSGTGFQKTRAIWRELIRK